VTTKSAKSSDVKRVERWLAMILYIQNPASRPTKQKIIEYFGISESTFKRDLVALSRIDGIPLVEPDKDGFYRFSRDNVLRPRNLNEDEIVLFSALIHLWELHRISPVLLSVYYRIQASLSEGKPFPAALQARLKRIPEVIKKGNPIYRKATNQHLMELLNACIDRRTVSATYFSRSRNVQTERLIDPYCIVPRGTQLYMIGYCHLRNQIRTFRLSRFEHVEVTAQTFTVSRTFDADQYLKDTWDIMAGQETGEPTTRVKVRFSERVASFVRERDMLSDSVHIQNFPGNGLILTAHIRSQDEFLRWLLQFGEHARILEPKSLVDKLRRRLLAWTQEYDGRGVL
jgi:predicted DNA-binding transcriptional regulator YafY